MKIIAITYYKIRLDAFTSQRTQIIVRNPQKKKKNRNIFKISSHLVKSIFASFKIINIYVIITFFRVKTHHDYTTILYNFKKR